MTATAKPPMSRAEVVRACRQSMKAWAAENARAAKLLTPAGRRLLAKLLRKPEASR
jgi:hypothetical protein